MKCLRCQVENDAIASFCKDYGARLEIACPSCGIPVTPGKKFCRFRGAAITTETLYTPEHLAEMIFISRNALAFQGAHGSTRHAPSE